MEPATTCYVVWGSLFGGGCLLLTLCLYSAGHEPNRVTPVIAPSATRYEDLINKPPEYEVAIAEQPLPPDYED